MKTFFRLLSVLVISALFLGGLPLSAARAASFLVTNTNDSGAGSLRAAINAANADTVADTITFGPGVTGTILLATELDILNPVTITGPGANLLTVSGNLAARVFGISANASISGLTIANGLAIGSNGSVSDNGAGILVSAGTLTLDRVTITGNLGKDSQFADPEGQYFHSLGGGVFVNSGASLVMTNSAVTSNKAFYGAALVIQGSADLTNCTIGENRSVAVQFDGTTELADGGMGAVHLYAGSLSLTNVTVTRNSSQSFESGLTLEANTITTLKNSIVSGNLNNEDIWIDGSLGAASNEYNLIGTYLGTVDFAASQVVAPGTPPQFAPGGLTTAQGGTTPYYPILNTSPAVNRIPTNAAPATDQRGMYRSGLADMGSFEYNGQTPAAPSVTSPTSASITDTSALLGGNITSLGVPASVSERGIYWSTTTPVTTSGTKVSETGPFTSTGTFTVTVSGLPSSTLIYYRAFATNATGTTLSSQSSFTTSAPPKDEPSLFPDSLTASANSTTAITTTWTQPISGILPDGFLLLCRADSNFSLPVDGVAQMDDTNCADGNGGAKNIAANAAYNYIWTGLTANTAYYFTIFPYTNAGAQIDYKTVDDPDIEVGGTRPIANASTPKLEPSNYPTNFNASAVNAVTIADKLLNFAIDVSWTDSTGSVLPDAYLVYCNTSASFTPPTDTNAVTEDANCAGGGVVSVNGGVQTYRWTGLNANTRYYFTIYPYSNSGALTDYKVGGTPPAADMTTDKAEPSNYPANFTATADSYSQITTAWLASTGTVTPDSYLVMCSTANNFTLPEDGTAQVNDPSCADGSGVMNVSANTLSYAWTSLKPGTLYYFTVFPATNAGSHINYKTGGTPSSANATTQPAPAPGSISASAIRINGFTLQWGAVSDATVYYLDVATDAGFTNLVTGFNNKNVGNATSLVVTGLKPNTTYYFRIRSEVSSVVSPNSLPANAKTLNAYYFPVIHQ